MSTFWTDLMEWQVSGSKPASILEGIEIENLITRVTNKETDLVIRNLPTSKIKV
jgi:hypothetical protein